MFTVLMYLGIGDTLRNLSIFPHQFIHQKFGLRTTAYYKPWQATNEHQYGDVFRDLAERVPSLRWGGETDEHRGPGAIANRFVREAIKACHHGQPRFFPLNPRLSPSEEAQLPSLKGRKVIGLQPHLTGTYTKAWPLENWQRFVALMTARHPDAVIVILEVSKEARKLALTENVLTTDHLSLCQLLRLFNTFSFVVSVDSWAKYAAAWNEVPQLIIVPDQRPQHPILTPDNLLSFHFAGIYGQKQNRTLGLERRADGSGAYTLDKMSDLSPEKLFEETERHIERFPLRAR
jgi:ADP-heptose:LPS heptosyltransferase